MEWNYDKLFANGNVLGIERNGRIVVKSINYRGNFGGFANESLSIPGQKIKYIIKMDDDGNVTETLFNRGKDIPAAPMPEIKTGDVIQTHNLGPDVLGVVVGDNIFWQDGMNDSVDELLAYDGVGKIWRGLKNFSSAADEIPIWRRKE